MGLWARLSVPVLSPAMTYGHVVALTVGACLCIAAGVAIGQLPHQSTVTYVALASFAFAVIVFAAGLAGLVWDRWLTR